MSPSLSFRLFCPTCQRKLPPTSLHLLVVTERGLHKASSEACMGRLQASVNLSAKDVPSPQPWASHADLALCLSCPLPRWGTLHQCVCWDIPKGPSPWQSWALWLNKCPVLKPAHSNTDVQDIWVEAVHLHFSDPPLLSQFKEELQ